MDTHDSVDTDPDVQHDDPSDTILTSIVISAFLSETAGHNLPLGLSLSDNLTHRMSSREAENHNFVTRE